ncbi:hypothetical protein [Butyrivibrio sp. MB2005]|uniref:hypothetical protein n=1 Tax=Butyrivibrio sp. MB2005 TaxID=1280678 RepID=UPI000407CCDF|nr:hypothetical protein [Butyrivibrio sp. MB2005]
MNVFERLHSGEAIDIRDEDAIVGTGSIVTKDIPDNAVAVGNPARVVKMIDKK